MTGPRLIGGGITGGFGGGGTVLIGLDGKNGSVFKITGGLGFGVGGTVLIGFEGKNGSVFKITGGFFPGPLPGGGCTGGDVGGIFGPSGRKQFGAPPGVVEGMQLLLGSFGPAPLWPETIFVFMYAYTPYPTNPSNPTFTKNDPPPLDCGGASNMNSGIAGTALIFN